MLHTEQLLGKDHWRMHKYAIVITNGLNGPSLIISCIDIAKKEVYGCGPQVIGVTPVMIGTVLLLLDLKQSMIDMMNLHQSTHTEFHTTIRTCN